MRWFVVMLVVVLMFASLGHVRAEVLLNYGFEDGDFSNWTMTIPGGASANVVGSHTSDLGATYSPPEGSYFAQLKTDGPGSLTKAERSFQMWEGYSISGYAAFDAQDYLPFDDAAAVEVWQSGTLIATPWARKISDLDILDYGDSPWESWSFTAPSTGIYTLQYSVTNSLDNILDSYALFDADPSSPLPNPVPAPTTLVGLLSMGVMGALAYFSRRRKRAA